MLKYTCLAFSLLAGLMLWREITPACGRLGVFPSDWLNADVVAARTEEVIAQRDRFEAFCRLRAPILAALGRREINLRRAADLILHHASDVYPAYLRWQAPVREGETVLKNIASSIVRHFWWLAQDDSGLTGVAEHLEREFSHMADWASASDSGLP